MLCTELIPALISRVAKTKQWPCTMYITTIQVLGWGLLSQIHPSHCENSFEHSQKNVFLMNIALIFDRCPRISAAVTPDKCACDSNNLRVASEKLKNNQTEKLIKGAPVAPSPGFVCTRDTNLGWGERKPRSLVSPFYINIWYHKIICEIPQIPLIFERCHHEILQIPFVFQRCNQNLASATVSCQI